MPEGRPPVVIQRILKGQTGVPYHKFEWRFPTTGERVPSYRPLPKRLAAEFLPQLTAADFFYMDRAEPSTGDWCSAGIIRYLQRQPCKTLAEITQAQGEAAVRHGQALAAVSCQFEGARGAMYKFRNRDGIEQEVEALGIS